MQHARRTPEDHRHSETNPRADPVKDTTNTQKSDGVGDLKPEHDVRIISVAPAKDLLQLRREDAEDLTVDVVDSRCKKENRANDPPVTTNTLRMRVGSRRHFAGDTV